MATAAFRIDIKQDVHNNVFPWDWEVIDLANLIPIGNGYSATAEEAEVAAVAWVKRHNGQTPEGREFYVDENGEPAERPAQ
jgi:hypothetical protein